MDVKSFNNSQSIKSINVRHHKITFTFEDDVTLSMNAVGECCSYSYFKQVAGYDFQDLVGRRIVKFTLDGPFRSEKRNNYGDIRRFKGYKFILDNDSDFKFFLINDSNGWYTGWIEINGEKITNGENSEDNISTLDDKELHQSSQEDIRDETRMTSGGYTSSSGASGGYTASSGYTSSSGASGCYTACSGTSGCYTDCSGASGCYTDCSGYTSSSGASGGYTACSGYTSSSGASGAYTSSSGACSGYTSSSGYTASSGAYTSSSGYTSCTGYPYLPTYPNGNRETLTGLEDGTSVQEKYTDSYVIITKCERELVKSKLNPNAKPFFPKV